VKLTLAGLRADLIARWKAAFARFDEVDAPIEAAETVYTQYPAYALSGYADGKIKPGARLARKPTKGNDDFEFQLDAQRRPLHVRYAHTINRVSWQGVYHYQPDEVECIEYCMQTRVPSLYNRLLLAGTAVLAEQRFIVNGGGADTHLKKLSAAKQAARILADPHEYFLYIARYVIEDGVTVGADELQEQSGEVYRPRLAYTYARGGKLQQIVQHWPGGDTRTIFRSRARHR